MGVFDSNTLEGVVDACRLLSGLVLLLAAFSKFGDLSAFRQVLVAIPLLSPRIAHWLVILIPSGEATLGIWLAYGGFGTRAAAFLAMLLFLVFAAFISFLLNRNQPFTCGCFGRLSKGQASWLSVARNLLFVASSLVTALLFDDKTRHASPGFPMVLAMLSLAVSIMLSAEIMTVVSRTSADRRHRAASSG